MKHLIAAALIAFAGMANAAAVLDKISPPSQKMAVWGFKNPVNASEVKAAAVKLTGKMSGDGNVLIVMTGTHGICNPPGLVGTQEIKFAEEDVTYLRNLKTGDGKAVTVQIWPINPGSEALSKPRTLEEAGLLTAFLNSSLRAVGEYVANMKTESKTVVLLAYCCSAGQ